MRGQLAPQRPVIYYCAYGTEVLLPTRHLRLTGSLASRLPGDILADARLVSSPTGTLTLTAAGRSTDLTVAGLGCAPASITLKSGRPYMLAFPRAFTHNGTSTLFYRSGSVQAGVIGDFPIQLYDNNLDGAFTKGADGICIGDPGRVAIFAPIADILPTPKGAYGIDQIADDGSSITLSPFAGPTGRLQIEPASTDLEYRLAFSSDDAHCSFATLVGEQALVLPAGEYRLRYGLIYRPLLKRAAAIILPGSNPSVAIRAGEEIKLVLGEMLKQSLESSEQAMTTTFDALLEIDLSAVSAACDSGQFDQAQKLLTDIAARHKAAPNLQATSQWMASVKQILELEMTPEAAALRGIQARVMAAINQGDRAAASQLLPQVREALAKIPARLANSWAWHAAQGAGRGPRPLLPGSRAGPAGDLLDPQLRQENRRGDCLESRLGWRPQARHEAVLLLPLRRLSGRPAGWRV